MMTPWTRYAALLHFAGSTFVLAQTLRTPPCYQATNLNSCVVTETLTPRYFPELKSQRILAKYGPFPVPPTGANHAMGNFMLPVPVPCEDCIVTSAVGSVAYPNGTAANVNTGMYLHHAVIFNNKSTSATCPGPIPEPIFAIGNERTPTDLSLGGTKKAGLKITKGQQFILAAEIMNDASVNRDVFVTVDWEFIPSIPADFRRATVVWLDVDGTCFRRGSEVPVPANTTVFKLVMDPAWETPFAGEVLLIESHLHDGGEDVQVFKNGALVCHAKARYGEKPAYVSPGDHSDHRGGGGGGGGHGGHDIGSALERRHEDMIHISSISLCNQTGRFEIGDKWSVTASYNLTKYAPRMAGDHYEPVMGISIMYVLKDNE